MVVVRVRHSVKDYAVWKRSFDADPLGRRTSGGLRYRILRDAIDELSLTIDLEFEEVAQAERMAERLRELWGRPQVAEMLKGPVAEVLVVVEEDSLS